MEHSLVMTVGKVISAHYNPNMITEGSTYRQMRTKSITTCSAARKRLKQTQKAPGLSSALPVKLLYGLKLNDAYNCKSKKYNHLYIQNKIMRVSMIITTFRSSALRYISGN